MTRTRLPHRGRAVVLGVILPAACLVAALVLVLSWRDRLPDPVAVHWGPDGVDRTGSLTELVAVLLVLGGVSWLITSTLCLTAGRVALTRRMLVGLSAGLGTMFAGMLVTTTATQLDITEATAAGDPVPGVIGAIAAALLAGIIAGLLAGADPPRPSTVPVPADVHRADVPDEEIPTWTGEATTSRPWLSWLALIVLLLVGVAIGYGTGRWWLLLLLAVMGVLPLGMMSWRVQVDTEGLTVTAALGWPRQHIPADEVVRADVIEVSPFHEFGGWGLRASVDGRTGVLTRAGPAIQVQRSGRRVFVVTTDGAAEGAALLNTMADRSRRSAGTD